eukprot:2987117-Amphidinium_carterae.2
MICFADCGPSEQVTDVDVMVGTWACVGGSLEFKSVSRSVCLAPVSAMARIVGKSSRVVDADGFKIDELAGNVATQSDRLSVAFVKANAGTAEPWLTLHYDEWICVLKGTMRTCKISQQSANDLIRTGLIGRELW